MMKEKHSFSVVLSRGFSYISTMINAIQHSIICETLTIWAAEFAAGFPTVHEAIYEVLSLLAMEFETCAATAGSAVAALPAVEETVAETAESCEEICAELVSLEPAIGLAGTIVPVAGIRNTELDHSTVFRCKVPHWGITDYLGLHRGCTVTLRKELGKTPELAACRETGRHAGMYVSETARGVAAWMPPGNYSPEMFTRPEDCPFCGEHLLHRKDPANPSHEVLVCVNPECRTQIGDRVLRFVSVGGMAIPGMTGTVVEQLLMEGKLDTVERLYSLTVKDFMDACHVSYTDAYVLMKSVERSKMKPMHMLLDAMGIPGISREITPALAYCIGASGGMSALAGDDPATVAKAVTRFTSKAVRMGITGKAAQQVVEFFSKYREMVGTLARLGVAQTPAPLDLGRKRRKPRGRRVRRRKPRKGSGDSE